MPIKEGSYIKVGTVKGTVTAINGQQITYQTLSGDFYTTASQDATLLDEPLMGMFAMEGPNFIEILENGVVFAALNKVKGGSGGFMGADVKIFIALDAVYEILAKKFLRSTGVEFLTVERGQLSATDYTAWGLGQDFYDAGNKVISLEILNIFKRLFYKQTQFNKERLKITLQMLASLYLSNLAHRKFISTDTATFRPQ